jgi:hypothetical protein
MTRSPRGLAHRTLLPAHALIALLALSATIVGAAVAAEKARGSYDRGLLWKVEKPGVAPSYLFGTVHVADQRVTALPDVVRTTFAAARSFAMEVSLEAANVAALAARMVYTDGRDLAAVAGNELFLKLTPMMADYGVPPEVTRLFKPWAVTLVLAVPQQQPEGVLDLVLFRIASNEGKPVHFLETVDEQVAVFEGMAEADQLALLKHTVETHDELAGVTEKLLQAYLQRDLARMWELNEESGREQPELNALNAALAQRLLFDRNVRMLERMRPLLEAGRAFIAVGALHLYGERGLPGLLARDGYRVSRIY